MESGNVKIMVLLFSQVNVLALRSETVETPVTDGTLYTAFSLENTECSTSNHQPDGARWGKT